MHLRRTYSALQLSFSLWHFWPGLFWLGGTGDFYRVEQKLYQLLPTNDTAMGTLRYHTRAQMLGSCAVVGNSGSLLYRQYGRAIDAHDVVYRFNQVRRFASPSTVVDCPVRRNRELAQALEKRWRESQSKRGESECG